jgi:hypothetical protein
MATTITQSFKEYASNLEITDRQGTLVSERRKSVVVALDKELSLYDDTSPSKVIGSYDRNTMIRKLSEGDVDVMVILHYGDNKQWDNAEGTIKALDKFKSTLDAAFPKTPKCRDRHCINMTFSEFRLDVVPAFQYNTGYYTIPDSVRQLWVPTDPFKFAEKITGVNKSMGNTFVSLIKMVKGWDRQIEWVIRSFHLECMMYNHFQYYGSGYEYPFMLKEFFSALPNYLRSATYDPVMGDRVDTYLDNGAKKREIAIEKANDAATKSREAYDDQTKYASCPSIAINEWKALLGTFFPAYG